LILVDTCAWIDLLRGSERGSVLQRMILDGSPIACTEAILMEVLAGARDDAERARLRDLLWGCEWLPVDPAADFEAAAQVFARCRAVGITPRGLVDCLIAAVALRSGAEVMTSDRDFRAMADVVGLRIT
jgi:predicted nucleic acid-binding protein